mmetsp:Transcript_15502/g.31806  ORF Transcript_15502/g.31806 Transcript_15502/m.31806 type:complete len:227 (+) Transcript_15502:1293-1973(+)
MFRPWHDVVAQSPWHAVVSQPNDPALAVNNAGTDYRAGVFRPMCRQQRNAHKVVVPREILFAPTAVVNTEQQGIVRRFFFENSCSLGFVCGWNNRASGRCGWQNRWSCQICLEIQDHGWYCRTIVTNTYVGYGEHNASGHFVFGSHVRSGAREIIVINAKRILFVFGYRLVFLEDDQFLNPRLDDDLDAIARRIMRHVQPTSRQILASVVENGICGSSANVGSFRV